MTQKYSILRYFRQYIVDILSQIPNIIQSRCQVTIASALEYGLKFQPKES